MTATPDNAAFDLQEIIAELQRQLAGSPCPTGSAQQRLQRLQIAYQAAANDVLKVMSASPGDPQPVFDLISMRARDICDAYGVTVCESSMARCCTGERQQASAKTPRSGTRLRRPIRRRQPVILPPAAQSLTSVRLSTFGITRTRIPSCAVLSLICELSSVVVPMMRAGVPIGTLHMGSRERGGFLRCPGRTSENIRRPSCDRYRERSVVQRGSGQDARPRGVRCNSRRRPRRCLRSSAHRRAT